MVNGQATVLGIFMFLVLLIGAALLYTTYSGFLGSIMTEDPLYNLLIVSIGIVGLGAGVVGLFKWGAS